ncbi:MAG TPA: nicotinate-nucleotide adenylyltransferase [Candidatus Eisenbacteria bacterium]|nr:nicotinate-nucleotide adenylyltransferase [Candidatus Eisenbacteria bacterium]
MRRIGILGGTFDPPHLAHLAAAEAARQDLDLDEVWFVPAGAPPHKRARRVSPKRVRLALLRAALAGTRGFRTRVDEVERRGTSYTVDTLERLNGAHPDVEWWLVIGTDMLADLPNWRRPERVLELAGVAAVPRPGFAARWPRRLRRRRFRVVDMPELSISSTDLRARARRGASIRYLVPLGVERLIRRRKLYGAHSGGKRA